MFFIFSTFHPFVGILFQKTVLEILKAQFPIDHEKLEKDLPVLWQKW
jgi:hypothetical protein